MDLSLPPELFAEGCKLLLFAAKGDLKNVGAILRAGKVTIDFRDYDRRTALHVAASEGDAAIVEFLVSKGARVSRLGCLNTVREWQDKSTLLKYHTNSDIFPPLFAYFS